MSDINDIDDILAQYLQFLHGNAPEPNLARLNAAAREEALAQIDVLVALYRVGTPDSNDDPVARRFGFDRAGDDITIDGGRVKRLRKERALSLKELVDLVNRAGGDTSGSALLRIEQQPRAVLPQATVTAIVAALDTTLQELEVLEDSTIDVEVDRVRAFLASPRFEEEIATWCAAHDRRPREVRPHVEDRLVGAAFRAEDQTDEVLLEIVRTILRGLEK